jgi:hypothetical protein
MSVVQTRKSQCVAKVTRLLGHSSRTGEQIWTHDLHIRISLRYTYRNMKNVELVTFDKSASLTGPCPQPYHSIALSHSHFLQIQLDVTSLPVYILVSIKYWWCRLLTRTRRLWRLCTCIPRMLSQRRLLLLHRDIPKYLSGQQYVPVRQRQVEQTITFLSIFCDSDKPSSTAIRYWRFC